MLEIVCFKNGGKTLNPKTHTEPTTIKAGPGSAVPDGKIGSKTLPKSPPKSSVGSSGKSEDSQVIQKHQSEENCAPHFPGKLCLVQFQLPGPCWVLG